MTVTVDGYDRDVASPPVLLVERPRRNSAPEYRLARCSGSRRVQSQHKDRRSLKLGTSGKPDCLIRTSGGVCPESDSHEAEHEGVDEPAALCFSQLEHLSPASLQYPPLYIRTSVSK